MLQSSFPREFARFVGFVGGQAIDNAMRRVSQKLAALSPEVRWIYGDRYYFHEEFERFSEAGFRLDTSRFQAVRAATVMAMVNNVASSLPPQGCKHLKSRVIDALDPARDIREIEHELRCYTNFALRSHRIELPELAAGGRRIYDWLVTATTGREIEIECKTIGEDAGMQIKTELRVGLYEAFIRYARAESFHASGLLTMRLRRPAAECRDLASRFKTLLRNVTFPHENADFSLSFEARPAWRDVGDLDGLGAQVAAELDNEAYCQMAAGGIFVCAHFRPHKPSTLADRVVSVLKDASDQCSGTRPSFVWLHFTGLGQAGFRELLAVPGRESGLNAAVALALTRSSFPVRRHVERVRFSADPDRLTKATVLTPALMIVPSVSVDGLIYDVPNPHCSFSRLDDL